MTYSRLGILAAAVSFLALAGAGCVSVSGTGSGTAADGGVFRSANRGDLWTASSAVLSVSGSVTFGAASVGTIVQDPGDPKALYVGTADHGMFYSYDGGQSWMRSKDIVSGRVWSIAVHPKERCTVFLTYGSRLLKTTDCSRSFSVPFLDSRANVISKAVAIDGYNPNVVWLALSTGDLLRSQDGGVSWTNIRNFRNEIVQLKVSTADSRRIYVATKTAGIWRTDDAGATWKDLSEGYAKMSGAKDFLDMDISESNPDILVFASKYGLIRSRDRGDSWEKVDLLAPAGQLLIYSLAIDPKDPDIIYYGTATTFNKTTNGGVNWITRRLPTTRAATVLMADRSEPETIWLGATKVSK